MSLAGVRSNRGDGYQTLVAFDWALSILADDNYQWLEVDSTSLDASGIPISVDDVVIGRLDDSIICCQCKKNQKDFQAWSVADLGDELAKAARFLADNPKSQVKFYTRGNFGALAKLREYLVTQPNETAYRQNLTAEHQKTDAALAKHMSGLAGLGAYELLSCTTFESTPDIERMQELLMERLTRLVSNAENAFYALWTRLDMLGARIASNGTSAQPSHRLSKAELQEILAKSGATFVPPLSQQEMQKSFASVSTIGRSWRRDIAGGRIHVATVKQLIDAIEAKERSVLLAGTPGSGKTCVLLELQETLETRHDLATLFIQTREYANCATPEMRTSHGLPEDVVGLVGRMADCKRTVVIIDSLDVLSLSREHTVLSFFLAQIDQLLLIPNVTVVAACRDFDRKYDSRLSERTWDRIAINAPLDWQNVVAPLVSKYGVDPESLDTTTRSLLQNPRELALFTDIAKKTGGFNIATSQALSRKYLETIVRDDQLLGDAAMMAIEQIAERMLRSRQLDIPRAQVQMPDETLKRLLSAEVLHENQSGNIEFGHQTLLDVLVISGAERSQLSLKAFIEKLPPVPFVRPTIRAYVAYIAAGDRPNFRKQLRAVFDSDAAFHIRRLVAEALAEQVPQDDDWSLIQHLHRQRRELFTPLYMHATSQDWHVFWLKFLIPYVVQERDAQSLVAHVHRIALWKKSDPEGVLRFWSNALKYDWVDREHIARNIILDLQDADFNSKVCTAALIETLLTFPRLNHDLLGHAVARCVDAGKAGDELLWRYIAGDIGQEDLSKFHFDKKLRCQPNEFRDKDFLHRRMLQSEQLLDLAIEAIEYWSVVRSAKYSNDRDWYDQYLNFTSYEIAHSQRDIGCFSAETVLFRALEAAILHHAKQHTDWWIAHRQQLCLSREGALRYLAILALIESPERNIADVACLVTDKRMLESHLRYELGSLIHASFLYLDEQAQDAVMSVILTLRDDENINEKPWVLTARAELVLAIPCHLRSPEAQATLASWEKAFGPCIRQPHIGSRGGWVAAPFSYQRFLDGSDSAVLKILSHYAEEVRGNWERDSLVGGAEQVEWQLREATSRSPARFMRLLSENWVKIPERFHDDMLDGAATYLAHRYGSLQFDANQWKPIEEPDSQVLVGLILDEIERHPVRWRHCQAAAKALEACANVIQEEQDAARLVFAAVGFLNCWERDYDSDSRDLIGIGINMIRGDTAEAVMLIATQWAETRRPFPELLVPTLRRFASDPHPAVRALVLWRLPYFQDHAPELGWEIFYLALEDDDERLWEVAEPCLYYAYHNRFDETSRVLDRMVSTATGKALETWGRISALAVLSGHIDLHVFILQLQTLGSIDAWTGAATVWSDKGNMVQHFEQCVFGISVGLQEASDIASSVAREMSSMFGKDHPLTLISSDIIDKYLSAIEQDQSDNRFHLDGFDEWLNAMSQCRPDEALISAERFTVFVRHTKYQLYGFEDISQLMTRLFREAEEREESDNGAMLRRVIALQDTFLAIGVNGLQDWLRDAERP
ncbi:MAG: ATP-binding protein [Methylobacter sp.]|nr:ATP-binding protein [Methylobacter sp.]